MAPRPYSERTSLPNESVSDSVSPEPAQVLSATPSPSTLSATTTPSPTPQEVVELPLVDTFDIQEESRNVVAVTSVPSYPTPDDIMPYDHSLPDFIRQITNQSNLANLHSLNLRVISTLISLHRMASYLPNLRELDLEGSVLNSLRDIGCSFKNLQILKVGRCHLESLDGTFGLSSLRELYAQKNLINDVSPCSNLPHIRHIDVSGNRIRNISYAGFLSVCSKLKSIVFTGNPAAEVADYRKHVRRILPQIESLDGVSFLNDDNNEEGLEPEIIENMYEGSDTSSVEAAEILTVSPSDSMYNLLESEGDAFLLDKKNKHARNVKNQDQCENSYESQGNFAETSKGTSEQTKLPENKKPTTSNQKLVKDIENRSKKSNFTLTDNLNDKLSRSSNTDLYDMAVPSTSSSNMRENFCLSDELHKMDFNEREIKGSSSRPSTTSRTVSASHSNDGSTGVMSGEGPSQSDCVSRALTTGLPVCGNLTAALRKRKKLNEP